MPTDFTSPWKRGMRVVPRKGQEPPKLEPVLTVKPLVDEKTGTPIKPEVIRGIPGREDYRIKPNAKA